MKRATLLGSLALVALVAAVYLPALRGGYVWDDDVYLTRNHLLTVPGGLGRIWFGGEAPSQYFPLVYTMFWLERRLWGLEPLGYHLVNVLLHGLGAVVLWRLLARLGWGWGWLAALVWAVHPVQAESVAWVTERKNVLSGLFFWLSVWWWERWDRGEGRRWWWFSFGSYAAGLLAKTTLVVLPAVLWLVSWVRGGGTWGRRVRGTAAFWLWGLMMGGVTVWWERHRQGTVGTEFGLGPVERLWVASRAVWFYLGKLVWPVGLTFSYRRWDLSGNSWTWWLWVAASLGAGLGLWRWRSRLGRPVMGAAAFFVVALAPMLGFVMLYTFRYAYVADHYQYLASAGPVALGIGLGAWWWRRRGWPSGWARAAAGCLVLVLGVLTWRQAGVYRDEESLWRDVIAKNPSSWMAHNNLGLLMAGRGDLAGAEASYLEALRIKPDFPDAYSNLGVALAWMGREDEALRNLDTASRLSRLYPEPKINMGNIFFRKNRIREAASFYREALLIDPRNPVAHNNLGVCLYRSGLPAEALGHYREAVRRRPDYIDAHYNLGESLEALGRLREAAEAYGAALQLAPGMEDARAGLTRVRVKISGGIPHPEPPP